MEEDIERVPHLVNSEQRQDRVVRCRVAAAFMSDKFCAEKQRCAFRGWDSSPVCSCSHRDHKSRVENLHAARAFSKGSVEAALRNSITFLPFVENNEASSLRAG